MSIKVTNSSGFPHVVYDIQAFSLFVFPGLQHQAWDHCCGAGLKSKKRMIGCDYDNRATIAHRRPCLIFYRHSLWAHVIECCLKI